MVQVLKPKTMELEEAAIARQWLGKHPPVVRDCKQNERFAELTFPVEHIPMLYNNKGPSKLRIIVLAIATIL
jgi:hypothetical protein